MKISLNLGFTLAGCFLAFGIGSFVGRTKKDCEWQQAALPFVYPVDAYGEFVRADGDGTYPGHDMDGWRTVKTPTDLLKAADAMNANEKRNLARINALEQRANR